MPPSSREAHCSPGTPPSGFWQQPRPRGGAGGSSPALFTHAGSLVGVGQPQEPPPAPPSGSEPPCIAGWGGGGGAVRPDCALPTPPNPPIPPPTHQGASVTPNEQETPPPPQIPPGMVAWDRPAPPTPSWGAASQTHPLPQHPQGTEHPEAGAAASWDLPPTTPQPWAVCVGGVGVQPQSPHTPPPPPPPGAQQPALTRIAVSQTVETAGDVPPTEEADHLGLHVAVGGLGGEQEGEEGAEKVPWE